MTGTRKVTFLASYGQPASPESPRECRTRFATLAFVPGRDRA
jgi:hypothetical protein